MYQSELNEIQLQNFKSFSKSATFPIRPITLIFGPNSSGKSSFLQSLLLLKQSANSKKSSQLSPQGPHVNLGDYKNFVYDHDIKNNFSVSFSFDFRESDKIPFDFLCLPGKLRQLLYIVKQFDTIKIKLSFGAIKKSFNAFVKTMEISLGEDSEPFLFYTFEDETDKNSNRYFYNPFRTNLKHPFWKKYWQSFYKNHKCKQLIEEIEEWIFHEDEIIIENLLGTGFFSEEKMIEFNKSRMDELDFFEKDIEQFRQHFLHVKNNLKGYEQAYELFKIDSLDNLWLDFKCDSGFVVTRLNEDNPVYREEQYLEFANQPYILFPILTQHISAYLDRFLYIGPLREKPSRHYVYTDDSFIVDSKGSNMPDMIYKDPDLLKKINKDLASFGQKYQLKVVEYINKESSSEKIYSLQLINVKSGLWSNYTDVGFGFSQLLPIITCLRASKNKTIMIEQPELHLHPSMQAEMADLMIDAVKQEILEHKFKKNVDQLLNRSSSSTKPEINKNSVIIETHSEHLILRILRRIRETTEGRNISTPPIYPDDVAVIYIQPGKESSCTIHIPITEDGEFARPWPNGFFSERAKELF
jgi:AAA15 family ATPase/GTPase